MTYYSKNAELLFNRYHKQDPDLLHGDWVSYLPEQPGLACDVGAGTGRDANWLAGKGWNVIAIEPEAGFRERGRHISHVHVNWVDDRLPELNKLRDLKQRFDLVLVSAVWMHVPVKHRERAFETLTDLLAPGGTLVISLRYSSSEEEIQERGFHKVSVEELKKFAGQRKVALEAVTTRPDAQGREYVSWETVVLRLL